MNDYTRNFCLSEFNRLLPMVRETIKKEQAVRKLKDEMIASTELVTFLSSLTKDCTNLTASLKKIKNLNSEYIFTLDELSSELNSKLSDAGKQTTNLTDQFTELASQRDTEKMFYNCIIRSLHGELVRQKCTYGFIKAADIQNEYLKEYLYLFAISSIYKYHLTLENLFYDVAAQEAFWDSLYKYYHIDGRKTLSEKLSGTNTLSLKEFFIIFP